MKEKIDKIIKKSKRETRRKGTVKEKGIKR